MTGPPATIPQHRNFAFALALLLTLAGLSLRFYRLSNQSFWTDEVSSVQISQKSLAQMTQESGSENVYLPGYFLLLGTVLRDTHRDVEFRARALSAIAGGLSVPLLIGVVFCWRRQWSTALMAGLLLAVNPLHLWYSQEVRGYAVMLFFGLMTLLAYERARATRTPWWWAGYALSALVAVALHKTAIIFPVACALWHGWEVWRQKERFWNLAVHVVVLGVICGAVLLRPYPPPPVNGRSRSILELGYTFMTFVGGYSFGPSITDIQSHGPFGAVSRHLAESGILAGVLLLVALAYALGFRRLVRGKETGLVVLNLGFVSLVTLIYSFPYNIRYTLPGLLAFLAVVAVLNSGVAGRYLGRAAFVTVLLVGLWADAQWFHSPVYRKADSRAVAQWLVDNQASVKSWTVLPEYLGFSVDWYLRAHPEILARQQPPTGAQTTSFPPVPDVLIIGRRHHIIEPDKIIAAYRASAGEVRTVLSIAGFELYVKNAAPAATVSSGSAAGGLSGRSAPGVE